MKKIYLETIFDIRANKPKNTGFPTRSWISMDNNYTDTILHKVNGGEIKDHVFRETYTQDFL